MKREIERKLIRAFRKKDWLGVCACARVLITLQEGPGMKPLRKGMAFNWR